MSNTGRTRTASVSDDASALRHRNGAGAAGTPQAHVTDFDDPSVVSEVYQDDPERDGDGEFET